MGGGSGAKAVEASVAVAFDGRIRFEAKAVGAARVIRLVLKNEARKKWLIDRKTTVQPGDWVSVDVYAKVPVDVDLLLRIDDEQVEAAPRAVSIQNLLIAEID